LTEKTGLCDNLLIKYFQKVGGTIMAARRRIYFDKSEVVLIVPGKKGTTSYNVTSSTLNRIEFSKCKEYKFGFIAKDSEQITIVASNLPGGVTYKKGENQAFFEEYKEEFRKFAKDNRIPLEDKTVEE
jgi:hypothetical protein